MKDRQESQVPWPEKPGWQPPDWWRRPKQRLRKSRSHAQNLIASVEAIRFDTDELRVHLRNKIRMLDFILERDKGFFGHLYNLLTGADLETIELFGSVAAQLLELVGKKVPEGLDLHATYRVPHQEVRALFATAFADQGGLQDAWR